MQLVPTVFLIVGVAFVTTNAQCRRSSLFRCCNELDECRPRNCGLTDSICTLFIANGVVAAFGTRPIVGANATSSDRSGNLCPGTIDHRLLHTIHFTDDRSPHSVTVCTDSLNCMYTIEGDDNTVRSGGCDANSACPQSGWRTYHETDIIDRTLVFHDRARSDECMPLCDATPECRAYTWSAAQYVNNGFHFIPARCHLKRSDMPRKVDAKAMSAVRCASATAQMTAPLIGAPPVVDKVPQHAASSCPPSGFLNFPNADLDPGVFTAEHAATHWRECERICRAPPCVAYTWIGRGVQVGPTRSRCYLKARAAPPQAWQWGAYSEQAQLGAYSGIRCI